MQFFTDKALWHEKTGRIYALLERVKISEEQSKDLLHLRKANRILSIGSTTAIEGNRLSVAQVSDVINGKPVWGSPQDIKEVQNAYVAYDQIPDLDPFCVDDFLKAHHFITSDLIQESGNFRSVSVMVVNSVGDVLHSGANYAEVPQLVADLLEWGKTTDVHPLIKSSAIHFMIEHIHPFRDGNGRIGRLWQTLILSKWNPIFEWMPVETIIYHNQARYYQALQESHKNGVDCSPFIDFMLEMLENSLHKFIDIATETNDVGINVGINVGIKEKMLECIKETPTLTIPQLATLLNLTTRTIERYIKELKEEGKIERTGSRKTGFWKINL